MEAFHFGAISRNWGFFAKGLLQQPLNSNEDFKPGTGLNINAQFHYVGDVSFTSHIQINARNAKRASGANAHEDNSGATLV